MTEFRLDNPNEAVVHILDDEEVSDKVLNRAKKASSSIDNSNGGNVDPTI